MEDSIAKELAKFKPLTADMLHKLQSQAAGRVHDDIGEAPQKEAYIQRAGTKPSDKIVLDSSWMDDIRRDAEPQDYLAAILALTFWIWSITHIFIFAQYISNIGAISIPDDYAGIFVSHVASTYVTQIAFMLISEVGVLYFFYRHMLVFLARDKGGSPLLTFSANYLFAIFFAIFTILANVWAMVSGIEGNYFWIIVGGFVGILLPFVNMFLGERFTELIAGVQKGREHRLTQLYQERDNYFQRRTELLLKYEEDVRQYWEIHETPETYYRDDNHNFTVYFAQFIIDYYRRYNKIGKEYNWIPSIERALAAREIAASRMGSSLFDEIEAMTLLFTQGE